jgi:hypothetical protein
VISRKGRMSVVVREELASWLRAKIRKLLVIRFREGIDDSNSCSLALPLDPSQDIECREMFHVYFNFIFFYCFLLGKGRLTF